MGRILLILTFFTSTCYGQVINEICPSNTEVGEEFFVGYLDWLEIYNPTGGFISLEGYTLTDEYSNPDKWDFPTIAMPPAAFLTLVAEKNSDNPNAISFAFPRSGTTIYMFSPTEELVDSMAYPEMEPNDSYGLIDGNYYYFDDPTPGDPNATMTGYKGYANQPKANLESGAYMPDSEVVLTPVLASETIYYSTNGSNPILATLYEGPFPINTTKSLRIVATADSMISSTSAYRTYFVNEYHNLPVVNIGVDSMDLFDNETGIFMMGPDANHTPPYIGANFWTNQDVRIYYEYFDHNFELDEAMDCHLEVFGGIGSRWRALKSVQLRGKKTYDQTYFSFDYFEEKDIDKFRRLVLRNGGNDFCNTCMKDAALHRYFMQSGLNIDLLAYNPVVVYINGHYLGIQNMREKADRYYIQSNYGLDPDKVNLLGQATLDEIEGSDTDFVALSLYAVNNDLAQESHYNWVNEKLDIESFVDYFVVQLYVNNRDWPNFNLKVWNAEGHEKWRYLCYDMDVGLKYNGSGLDEQQSLAHILDNYSSSSPHVAILSALLDNTDFRRYFINRYCDLLNTTFDPVKMYGSILEQKAILENDMERHFNSWCGAFETWHERFNGQRGFIEGRELIVQQELEQVFELPEAVDMTFDVFPSGAASVKLNTLTLAEFPFYGNYFTSNKIRLTAQLNPGEIFKYWKNLRTGEEIGTLQIEVDPADQDHWLLVCHSFEIAELQTVPNPTKGNFVLHFSLVETSAISIGLCDLQGNVVRALVYNENFIPGRHKLDLDISELPAGHYVLLLTTSYGREASQIIKVA